MSKPRETLYPSLLDRFRAENRDITDIKTVAERQTAWFIVMDRKGLLVLLLFVWLL